MQVILAEEMGMCFGVRDALRRAAEIETPHATTIHGELVHNEVVLQQLAARGFHQQPEGAREGVPETPTVMITAHGISDTARERLLLAGKTLIDTTCPLVRRVHEAAQRLQRDGFHVLVLGKRGHVEVRGIVEDLRSFDVVAGADDVRQFPVARLGIVCQTTFPPHLADELHERIVAANPQAVVRRIDTICDPTQRRQRAMEKLLAEVEAVIVVGGEHSNNTQQLVNLCRERGRPALHVRQARDLDPAWLANYRIVGLTAGTSTLETTIAEVHAALLQLP